MGSAGISVAPARANKDLAAQAKKPRRDIVTTATACVPLATSSSSLLIVPSSGIEIGSFVSMINPLNDSLVS